MKDVFSLALILFIVLKLIDFSALSAIDVIILVLFVIYAAVELYSFISEKRSK